MLSCSGLQKPKLWGEIKPHLNAFLREPRCPLSRWGSSRAQSSKNHIPQATPALPAGNVSLAHWTLFLFLPDSHCRCLKEGPRYRGQGGEGSHWDSDQHSHKCCYPCSGRPGQTGTVSTSTSRGLFLNLNKKLWNVYTEPWIFSCLDGNPARVPSGHSAGAGDPHVGSFWGSVGPHG